MPDELYYEPLTDKYRPRLLEEVVGQHTPVQILRGMLASKKIARTFLMTGPHSTGKTTLARIIARYVNCEKGPKTACGVCRSCKALDLGTHPDVTEIDAASNRGINEARELISQSNLSPMYKKRVFIIDECYPGSTLVMVDHETAVPIRQVVEQPENFPTVLAYDLETRSITPKKVTGRFTRPYVGTMVRLRVGGREVVCTERQEIFVAGRGYVPACDVRAGDQLVGYTGSFEKKHSCEKCGSRVPPRKMSAYVMQRHYEETVHKEKNQEALETPTCCPYCGDDMPRRRYPSHLTQKHRAVSGYLEAVQQEVPCKYCGCLLPKHALSGHYMSEHYDDTAHKDSVLRATETFRDCPLCGESICLSVLGSHMNSQHRAHYQIDERMRTQLRLCPYCGESVPFNKYGAHMMKDHYELTTHGAYTASRRGGQHSSETKQRISEGLQAFHETEAGEAQRQRFSEERQGSKNPIFRYMTPSEVSAYMSKRQKAWWDSLSEEEEAWRTEVFINAPKYNNLPNKVETTVIEWDIAGLKYVGDGQLFMTLTLPDGVQKKKNPDFVYKEDGKVQKIVEVMDFEYWHTVEEAQTIISAFGSLGYPCLVVDAARLKTEPTVVRGEVDAFCNNHTVEVEAVETFTYRKPKDVYDLEVEEAHNFFVVPGNYGKYGHQGCVDPGTPILSSNCHALTPQASEAMLKTLEEPASSTIFILCTTDPGKLKKTIRSRCKWFKLQPLSHEDCGGLVHDTSVKEGMPLSLDDSKLIARYAYGHPREALHLLENVIDFAAGGESTDDLSQVLSRVVNEALQMSPEMLAETYAENLLQVIPNVVYKLLLNVDNAPAFLERVCYIFRQNLVIYTGGFQAVDSYFDQWFSKKEWKRDWDIDHMLCIYKLHLEAMMQASTYTMDPYELLMSTAIQSIKIMMTCERNGS